MHLTLSPLAVSLMKFHCIGDLLNHECEGADTLKSIVFGGIEISKHILGHS